MAVTVVVMRARIGAIDRHMYGTIKEFP